MSDYEKSILLNALTEKKLDVKTTSCEAPLSFSLLALSNNSLSYYSGNALSAWCNHHQITVLDLSNNPMLGGALVRNVTYLDRTYSWMFSSGLQLIARALRNNTTLKMLILAACGADDKDFLTLVDMLKVNSGLRDLELSQNSAITETQIQKNLPTLYNLRYTRQLRALRPRLDSIIKKKEHSKTNVQFNFPSPQTIFHQNIRAHIEQLRLHSLGVQIKSKNVEVHHGSVWDQISHFLHFMVLVSSTAGVVLGVVEILKTMKFSLHNFEHGVHKTEDIIEVFEKLHLGSMGLIIILDIITKIRETGGELSEEFYSRYQKHGFKQTMMRTLWDFIHYLYALLESEHKADLLVFFEKFDQLAISINTDKVATELAHNFSGCENRINNAFEVELLTGTVAQLFNQFYYDSHVMIDWSCVAQEFSHWISAKEPVSSEVVKIDRRLVIFTGDEDTDRELRDQSDDEWAIDVIRRRGFQCYGKDNKIITFNVKYKKLSADKKSHEWITTDGDRFGYYPIEQKFLGIIQEKIKGYKKENAETRIIRIDKVGVEYEIPEEGMERLSHHTLTAILSRYQPTEEQLRNIQAAITDLRAKVEALSVKTEENTAELARVKQRVVEHDTKHQQADEKLDSLKEANRRITTLEEEKEAQKNKMVALESEVDILEKQKEKDQKELTDLREDVGNCKAALATLNSRLEMVMAAVDNAAHNADIAGRRADGLGVPVQGQVVRVNNNQHYADPDNEGQGHENATGHDAQGQERSPSSLHAHIGH